MTSRSSRRTDNTSAGAAPEPKGRPPVQGVQIPSAVSVHQLADLLGVNSVEVIKQLMRTGMMATINNVISYETASSISAALGYKVAPLQESSEVETPAKANAFEEEDPSKLRHRPPIVTILGHVDHGKTTLLDTIRHSNLVDAEVGGITQHIGAYQSEYNGEKITFIDTPGHEAFTAMRARGAQVTDIAILVVAADDGLMPQSIEAINHAKAANVPIVVAINKMDKPDSDAEKVKRQLSEQNLLIEEWGGDVIAVSVSAKDGQGIDELLQNILVVAEVAEYKANPDRPAAGVVIEARIDKSRGPMATILVQTGTLRVGDNLVVGEVRGRVKAMMTETGQRISEAPPSTPVELLGLDSQPQVGDTLMVVATERIARDLVEQRQRERQLEQGRKSTTLEELYASIESGQVKDLNLIIKTDVQGTVEAVHKALERLSTDKARIRVIHAAAGSINESDVLLAVASKGIIIGFNSRPDPSARRMAEMEGVEVRFYDIIYNLIEDVEKALLGLVEPEEREIVDGHAEVRAIFDVGRRNRAAGVFVLDGKLTRASTIRVLRKGELIAEGTVSSLKRFKDDVREVLANYECGIAVTGFHDYQEGDILEAYRKERAASR